MKTFHCSTCWSAGRAVTVKSETTPTEAETHKAHKGYGLGLGTHAAAEMVDGDMLAAR